MEILSLIIAAKMSSMPLATGLYRFEWRRAWVDAAPAPKVLRVGNEDETGLG